jgi:hypothetical protein
MKKKRGFLVRAFLNINSQLWCCLYDRELINRDRDF